MVSSQEQNYRRFQQQLFVSGLGLAGLFVAGTLWYRYVELWSWSEAAYMTTITLSTVGFSEVRPLPERSRIFTVAIILLGLVNIGYIVNLLTEAFAQGYLQQGIILRQRQQLMAALDSHYIICGFGRMGQQVAREFQAESIPMAIVETRSDRVEKAEQMGYLVISGDATLDETLLAAKIERAICLVAALSSDADNLYTIISAKTLNPSLRAIARANEAEAIQKLQRAGADAVVSPQITGGRRLAAAALRPQVMDFVDGIVAGSNSSFYIEEFRLERDACPLVGQSLSQAQLRSRSGALVVAIRRADGTLIGGPRADAILLEGDVLFCMGTAGELRQLDRLLYPQPTSMPRTPKS